jgi:catechol 2,3-dioxygenase-like lactoylglutathione lyase family enzyme
MTHLNLDARDLDAVIAILRRASRIAGSSSRRALRVEHPSYLLVLNAGEPKVGGTFHFGFRVAGAGDVDGWTERLRSHRVPIIVEPKHVGSVYVARVADPDSYEIEIYADL